MKIIKLTHVHKLKIKHLFFDNRLINVSKKYNYVSDRYDPAAFYDTFCQTFLSNLNNFHALGVVKKNKIVSIISFYQSVDDASWYLTHVRSSDTSTLKFLTNEVVKFNESCGKYKFFSKISAQHKDVYRRLLFDEFLTERYDYFDEFYVQPGNKCNFTLPWQILFSRVLPSIKVVIRCTFLKHKYRTTLANGGNL